MQDLAAAAAAVAAEEPHSAWLGGLTNHEDAFLPMYRLLLALHVAAAVPDPTSCHPARGESAAPAGARASGWAARVGARLQQAAEALLRAPLQLLLGNLLAQVLDNSSYLMLRPAGIQRLRTFMMLRNPGRQC